MIVNEDRIKEIARSMDVYRRTGGAKEMYRAFEDLIDTVRALREGLDLALLHWDTGCETGRARGYKERVEKLLADTA